MAEVQKAALESYNKIKAERGEVTALDMFIAGRDWFKGQMMKDAVEGMVCGKVVDHINVRVEGYHALTPSNITHIPCERKNFHKFEIGDKVKVIIIKE